MYAVLNLATVSLPKVLKLGKMMDSCDVLILNNSEKDSTLATLILSQILPTGP